MNHRLLLPLLFPALLSAATFEEGLALKKAERFAEAEAAFTSVLAADPGQVAARAERATVRGWQQHYDLAIADWNEAIAARPQEPDYLVGLARVQFWKGDRAAALATLDRALLLKPRDPEIWELKGDIARADHNRSLALTAYREADRLDPRDRVGDKLGQDDRPPQPWRIDVGGMRDEYSDIRSLEASGYASVAYADHPEEEGGPRWTSRLGTQVEHRFDAYDVTVEGEASARLYPMLRLIGRGGYTPSADFNYDWAVGGGLELRPMRNVGILFDLDHKEYRPAEQTVLQASPALVVGIWKLNLEARYRATVDHVPGATDKGDAVIGKVGIDLGPVHPYIAYLQGREPDPPLPMTDVKAWWGGLIFDLDQNLSVRVDGAYEQRKDAYNRTSLGGGLTYRF
jgi:YaiO family outer membrane protein